MADFFSNSPRTMNPSQNLPPWLKPKKLPARLKLGVAWYSHDHWKLVKEASVDQDRFEASYAEWVEMAERALKDFAAAGLEVEKSYIHADELLAWCIAHDKTNDAAARAEFVAQQGIRSDKIEP